LGSPARPLSKKSRAHKNISASSKAVADPQPTRTAPASGPPPQSKAQGSSSAFVVEEGSSVPKRKFGEDIFATRPPPKRGRADKARELLRMIAFVRSNSIPTSFGPFGESGRCTFLGPFRWGGFFGHGSPGRPTRGERRTKCQWQWD
jgi:hypothetical protein